MRPLILILTAAALLTGCTWETYRNEHGKTSVRQKYPTGTPVYYQDGTYSRNMNYNQHRPERRAIQAEQAAAQDTGESRQHWQKPQFQNR